MGGRRLLVVAGTASVLLLAQMTCSYPPQPEEIACIPPPPPSEVSLRWYDSGTLVFVAAGEFSMGVQGGQDNPEHRILLDEYWIHKTEVTNGMYGACVAAGGCTAPGPDPSLPDFSNPDLKDHPVAGVTWAQADTYCRWIEGRLPTEAEWEKAARGTDARMFPWGNEEPDCDRINFQQCVRELTHVLEYPTGASPYGGLDFSGNANEWASDWYKASYYLESPAQNPPGPENGEVRVVRSGSFESTISDVRTTARFSADPLAVRADLGFRCVVTAPQRYSPPCEIPAHAGQPYTPRRLQSSEGDIRGCEPPAIDVRIEGYCQQKSAWANITPNGAEIKWPEGADCHVEGDRIACTGEIETSFEVQACTSCVPPAPEPGPAPIPVCPPGYGLDATGCACRVVPASEDYCTTCPSAFSLLYVPAPQCCEPKPGSNLARALPRCDPGYTLLDDCRCGSRILLSTEEVIECETITVSLPHCGPREGVPVECAPQGCQQPGSWDSDLCCCAVRGKCQ